MSELRRDPLFERTVIVAPQRASRPLDFQPAPSAPAAHREACPFCEGHEAEAHPELLAIRRMGTAPDSPGWSVRVVANKYPIAHGSATSLDELQLRGVHDVIIEAPEHVASWSQMSAAQIENVLRVYRQRLDELYAQQIWRYALIFKNVGPQGGASLEHVHSQLLALPMIPAESLRREQALCAYRDRHNACGLCRQRHEESHGERRVCETAHFSVWCPYASRQPYEMWVVPKAHRPHVEQMTDAEQTDLAELLGPLLRRLEALEGEAAYNMVWQSAPWEAPWSVGSHWHLEIIPRLTRSAGFEWASQWSINPLPPEQAAAELREVNLFG